MHQISDRGSNHVKGNLRKLSKCMEKSCVDSLVYEHEYPKSKPFIDRSLPEHKIQTLFESKQTFSYQNMSYTNNSYQRELICPPIFSELFLLFSL